MHEKPKTRPVGSGGLAQAGTRFTNPDPQARPPLRRVRLRACSVLVVTWFRKRKRLLCLAGCSDKVLLGKVQHSAVAGTWPLCVLGHVHSAAADCVRLSGAEENRPPAGTSELSRVETLKMSSKRGAQRCGGLSLGKERTGPAWEVFCVLNLDDLTQPPAGVSSVSAPRTAPCGAQDGRVAA